MYKINTVKAVTKYYQKDVKTGISVPFSKADKLKIFITRYKTEKKVNIVWLKCSNFPAS